MTESEHFQFQNLANSTNNWLWPTACPTANICTYEQTRRYQHSFTSLTSSMTNGGCSDYHYYYCMTRGCRTGKLEKYSEVFPTFLLHFSCQHVPKFLEIHTCFQSPKKIPVVNHSIFAIKTNLFYDIHLFYIVWPPKLFPCQTRPLSRVLFSFWPHRGQGVKRDAPKSPLLHTRSSPFLALRNKRRHFFPKSKSAAGPSHPTTIVHGNLWKMNSFSWIQYPLSKVGDETQLELVWHREFNTPGMSFSVDSIAGLMSL